MAIERRSTRADRRRRCGRTRSRVTRSRAARGPDAAPGRAPRRRRCCRRRRAATGRAAPILIGARRVGGPRRRAPRRRAARASSPEALEARASPRRAAGAGPCRTCARRGRRRRARRRRSAGAGACACRAGSRRAARSGVSEAPAVEESSRTLATPAPKIWPVMPRCSSSRSPLSRRASRYLPTRLERLETRRPRSRRRSTAGRREEEVAREVGHDLADACGRPAAARAAAA